MAYMSVVAEKLIDHYRMERLPLEGTLFASTYQSEDLFSGEQPLGTAIVGLYCDKPQSHSLFHKLAVDEVWHFYAGDPFRLILIYPDGTSQTVIMGNSPLKGQRVQFVVPAGVWQAGHMMEGGEYSLFGCTMAPGFKFDLFEGGGKEELLDLCPELRKDISRFCCEKNQKHMAEEIRN